MLDFDHRSSCEYSVLCAAMGDGAVAFRRGRRCDAEKFIDCFGGIVLLERHLQMKFQGQLFSMETTKGVSLRHPGFPSLAHKTEFTTKFVDSRNDGRNSIVIFRFIDGHAAGVPAHRIQ